MVVFRQLGIPVYVVWDGDHGSKDGRPESNKYLLRLLCQPEEEWPHFVRDSCACLKIELEKTLEDEIGKDYFTRLLEKAQRDFGIVKRDHAIKNSAVIQYLIETAASEGRTSMFLNNIIERIVDLKDPK